MFKTNADGEPELFPIQDYLALARGNPLGMAAILQSHFPDEDVRFDKNGNPYVERRSGPVYLNKPGASLQDVTETAIAGAAAVGASRLGAGLGAGVMSRAGWAGLFNGATSLGFDGAAGRQGSKQDYDVWRAGIEGAFGAGGEVLETILRKVIINFANNPAMFDSTKGAVTSKGAEILEAAGIKPSKMTSNQLDLLTAGSRSSGVVAGASASGAGRMLPHLPRAASNTWSIGNAATGSGANNPDNQK
jgi:hypothetical protein